MNSKIKKIILLILIPIVFIVIFVASFIVALTNSSISANGSSFGSYSGNSNEKASTTAGIKGYYSSSSGRVYTEYWQNIAGTPWYWDSGCFHCSLATIMSGYGSKKTPNQLSGWGTSGYQSDAAQVGCNYPNVNKNGAREALIKGDPVMLEIPWGGTLTTFNGSHTFSLNQHWVALLDTKKQNGKYMVYVHDPWQGEPCFGWGDLDTVLNVGSQFIHFYQN